MSEVEFVAPVPPLRDGRLWRWLWVCLWLYFRIRLCGGRSHLFWDRAAPAAGFDP